MPDSVASFAIKNAVLYERYKASHVKSVIPLLNALNKKISTIVLGIDHSSPSDTRQRMQRINNLIDETFRKIQAMCLREYKELVVDVIEKEEESLLLFGAKEGGFQEEEKQKAIGGILASLLLGKSFIKQLAHLKRSVKVMVVDQIKTGISDNESNSVVAGRIRGTASRKFRDGKFNAVLANTASVLNTAVTAFVNRSKQWAWKKAGIKKYLWLSILDGRTTPICRGRSNKVYPVGQGPLPPAHHNCRSTTIPYKKGMEIPQSYSEWLRKQPREDVEEFIGKGKAALFLDKKLTLDRFVVANGKELTLKQIKQRGTT